MHSRSRHILAILMFIQALAWTAQAGAAQSSQPNPFRSEQSSVPVQRNFSDWSTRQNPLRTSSSNSDLRVIRTVRSKSQLNQKPITPLPSNAEVTIRLVQFQDETVSDKPIEEISLPPLAQESQPNETPIENSGPELETEDQASESISEPLPDPNTSIGTPIRNNPFAEARQSDPNGLLLDNPQGHNPKLVVERYSDVSGRENPSVLAGYNAHRLGHNPLYFEEPNLERYGNELEFQRVASTAKFFARAALLPLKAAQSPPCSTVTTLGHRRPGEFVPYRHYSQLSSDAGRFLNSGPHQTR